MEGLTITEQLREMCLAVLDGESTLEECLSQLNAKYSREGNGRVQRLYLWQLAQRAGYRLNFAGVDSDEMMIATIHAANCILDTLHQVFERIVEKSQ